jgi:anaerobic selenocysteine-containing dehydrogenase
MITGKPYPVKACLTIASNPMVTQPNTKLVYKALKSLDLYVVQDYWLTPSAEIADYVLPTASWIERPFLYSQGGGIDAPIRAGEQALPAAIEGEFDRKNDFEIFREISVRLGFEEHWPWKTLEESYDYRLTPMGMTFKEFIAKGGNYNPEVAEKKHETMGFGTPTGKLELSSTIFADLGYDPLPRYEESHVNFISTPELAKEYPLMLLTGGRFQWMFHSEHRQVHPIRKHHPHPLVQVHPETARKLGIDDGDWVWIQSKNGRVKMKCTYFDGMDPRVVHAEHGWWFPELPGEEPWLHGVWESNINVLLDDDPEVCNKYSGGWPLKTGLCKIYKAIVY